ncbi:MAG: hypothetical protein IT178_16330 [Acidobacteria bacterium]|nr:hypothetical protein [Acidobacteriota bacterium]
MATLAEITEKALQRLQVIGEGDEMIPADSELVQDRYASLLEMLRVEGLADWTYNEQVPEYAEGPLVMMLAAFCAEEFAVPEPRHSRLQQAGAFSLPARLGGPSVAERTLRRLIAVPPDAKPVDVEYY